MLQEPFLELHKKIAIGVPGYTPTAFDNKVDDSLETNSTETARK